VIARCRLEADLPGIHLKLRVNWHGYRELLKLVITPDFKVLERIDGCSGGVLPRQLNGKEYPIFNQLTVKGEKQSLTLLSPNIFSGDVQPDGTIRLTLLRSTAYSFSKDGNAYDLPPLHDYPITDQGVTDFDLMLLPNAEQTTIAQQLYRFTQPLKSSETTRGLKR